MAADWLSAGVSLLGGLFGPNSAKKARAQALEDERLKFVRLREAAELAGFDPGSVLDAAGGSFGSNLPTGAAPLASIEMVQNAISDFGQIASGEEAKRRAKEQLEYDLLKIQVDKASHSGARSVAAGLPSLGRTGVSSSTQAVTTPPTKFKTGFSDERTSVMVGGNRISPHMGYDDAEHVEKRYGDVGSSIYGLAAAVADWDHTYGKPRREAAEAERKRRNPLGLPPLQVQNFGVPVAYRSPPYSPSFWDYLRGAGRGYPVLRAN